MKLGEVDACRDDDIFVSFDAWTKRRRIVSWGSNAGAEPLPFQAWHHFKEAFAPEIVARAVQESERPVRSCLDPFGGSGTTALASQFLGVTPTTIEVNPYLADLIEAKLCVYDTDDLVLDLGRVVRTAEKARGGLYRFNNTPPTFLEHKYSDRWIFDRPIASRLAAYLDAIDGLTRSHHRRLFRVLLGGMLVAVSNVVVNGKGRRYRRGWAQRNLDPRIVDHLFRERCKSAISQIHEYRYRKSTDYHLLRGSCLNEIANSGCVDLAIFSPPYPNSFDYTDVYNIELWMLGYLDSMGGNRDLRRSTLCSHVQVKRDFEPAPRGSLRLARALGRLRKERESLWSKWIPEMVGHYFHDMSCVLEGVRNKLHSRGEVWAVVGDSRYAGVHIPVARILADFAPNLGYEVLGVEPFRSMRTSAQQGGQHQLDESLLVLRKSC